MALCAQVSFIDFVVHPLWETWAELVGVSGPGADDDDEDEDDGALVVQTALDYLLSNRAYYMGLITSAATPASAPAAAPVQTPVGSPAPQLMGPPAHT